jgi:uncharacterized protein YndB with AHSA1/START domain
VPDILHSVAIKSPADEVYRALTTIEGLSGWWTTDTQGDAGAGGVIHFRFGANLIDMKVLELEPRRRVLWQVVGGPDSWMDTRVRFDLAQDGGFTRVLFKHQGWKEPGEFMHHCSTKWAMFVMSLKALVETGTGAAYPNDVHISDKGD